MIKVIAIILACTTTLSYAANYRIISKDYLTSSTNVEIVFNQRIDKKSGMITFKTCAQCESITRPFDAASTEFYIKEGTVEFDTFKSTVLSEKRSRKTNRQKTMISIDTRPDQDGVFAIYWNYQQR